MKTRPSQTIQDVLVALNLKFGGNFVQSFIALSVFHSLALFVFLLSRSDSWVNILVFRYKICVHGDHPSNVFWSLLMGVGTLMRLGVSFHTFRWLYKKKMFKILYPLGSLVAENKTVSLIQAQRNLFKRPSAIHWISPVWRIEAGKRPAELSFEGIGWGIFSWQTAFYQKPRLGWVPVLSFISASQKI